MNPLKRISGWFNLNQREYGGASADDIVYSWLTQPETPHALIKNNLTILRARSRDQVNNNDYAKRFIEMVKTHVVGPDGFTFQARSADLDGRLDKLANDAIEGTFKEWQKPRNCDISECLSFKEMQRLIIGSVATDGEVFIIKNRTDKKHGFSLQLLDPEYVPVKYIEPDKNIYFGIEYDNSDRPINYHITTSKNNPNAYEQNGVFYEVVPADRVYHIFKPEKIGQRRGIPWMSTALLRMKMLNGYEDAALVNARVGASKMGFFTSQDGQGYSGDDQAADGSLISEVSPGTMEQLPMGVDFKAFDPAYPSNEFESFTKGALRGIAAGLGVSYYKLGNNLEGVNYSSGRLGELEDRELWKALQDWFIDTFLTPVYEDWLKVQLGRGTITVNGRPLREERYEKYLKATFQGRRWQWVDPQKEVTAQEKQIELGLRSRSDIIREQGRDPDDVWLEIQRENQRMQELGITEAPQQDRSIEEIRSLLTERKTENHYHIQQPRHEISNNINVPEQKEPKVNVNNKINVPEQRMEPSQVKVEVNPTPINIQNNVETPTVINEVNPADVKVENNIENKIENNKSIKFKRDSNGKITSAETDDK